MKTSYYWKMEKRLIPLVVFLAGVFSQAELVLGQSCPLNNFVLLSRTTSTNKIKWGFPEACGTNITRRFLRRTYTSQSVYQDIYEQNGSCRYDSETVYSRTDGCLTSRGEEQIAANGYSGSQRWEDNSLCGGTNNVTVQGNYYEAGSELAWLYEIASSFPVIFLDSDCGAAYAWSGGALGDEFGYLVGSDVVRYDYEYTDAMLREDLLQIMPPYPTEWTPGSGVAYWIVYPVEDSHGITVYGAGGRMQYRIVLLDTEKDVTYEVQWDEVTTYPDGTPSRRESKVAQVRGTGDPNNPPFVQEELDVPKEQCYKSVDYNSIKIREIFEPGDSSGGGPAAPGTGTVGGSLGCQLDGGGCTGNADTAPGIWMEVSMGAAGPRMSAGKLTLRSSIFVSDLFTPIHLTWVGAQTPNVEVIKAEFPTTNYLRVREAQLVTNQYIFNVGATQVTNYYLSANEVEKTNLQVNTTLVLRQVKAPQALADIVVVPNGYEIRFYKPDQVGTAKVGGVYPIIDPNPFVIWRVENPNPPATNQLRISEIRSSTSVREWNYFYWPESGKWTLRIWNANEIERVSTNTIDGRQEVITWRRVGGQEALRIKRLFRSFQYDEVLVREEVGSDSNPQVTVYSYYLPGTFGVTGKILLQSVIYPDGSWVYYHSYNTNGLPVYEFRGFGDEEPGGWGSRTTVYMYGPGYGDDGTINPHVPRKVIEYLQWHPVSCRYTLFPSPFTRIDVQCLDPQAQWDDPNNLFTTNKYYQDGPYQFMLKLVVHPDKTLTTYSYATNATGTLWTNIVAHGTPDPTYTTVIDGTITYSVITNSGWYLLVETRDIATGVVLSRDMYSNFDEFGRPRRVTHLDGTYEDTYYSTCCGTVESTTDRDGVLTQYLYDAAGRQTGYRKVYGANVITYTNVLDAAGRVLRTDRLAGGSQVTTHRALYDLAGRLVGENKGLGGGDAHAETTKPQPGGLNTTTQ